MAVFNTVNLSSAFQEGRLSAEFWKPAYTAPLKRELAWTPLGELLTTVQYGISRKMNEEGVGVPCYRMNEMDGMFLTSPRKSMPITTEELDQYRLNRRDVLFNRTNSLKLVGRTGYCGTSREAVFASYLIRLGTDTSRLLPEFLTVYLNTSVGVGQVKRRAMESINQANVSGSEIKQVPIPLFDLGFQRSIAKLVRRAARQRELAIKKYDEAEEILSSALGLQSLDLENRLSYERRFSDVRNSNRLDAEYHSPRMQGLLDVLSRDETLLGDVVQLARRSFSAASDEFDYIEISDIAESGIAGSKSLMTDDAPSRAKWVVEEHDVITTTVRPIRKLSAIITDEQDGYVCSSGFAVLEPIDIEPEVLLVYLRLPPVCEILDLHTTASMYPAISVSDLLRIPIALPGKRTRTKIVNRVLKSFEARREFHDLLSEAVEMLETAILGE